MVKVFPVEKIREADQYTIEHEPISSLELMERAAKEAHNWINQNLPKKGKQGFSVFCGVGNNGGDGLVIARLLSQSGANVEVFVVKLSDHFSDDFKSNLDRLPIEVTYLTKENHEFNVNDDRVVLDCIFGTGLNRKVEGFSAEIIKQINKQSILTIAIDIPSGLFPEDNSKNESHLVIKADHTLTFQFPKLAFLFPQNRVFTGEWHLIDIGLHEDYIKNTNSDCFYFTLADAKSVLQVRNPVAHKGNHGRALILAGSKGKMGAAVLATRACLRAGVGLMTIQIPEIGYSILQSQVPEAMVETDSCQSHLAELKRELSFSALGIGPGIGKKEETQKLLKQLIQEVSSPMVLDADALNILSDNKTWLSFLPKGSILTPHPGEFRRLAGEWESDYQRFEKLKDFSKKYGLYIVLKGKYSSTACPDGKVFFNSSGNSGMATGGSGDALTGIITSLLAQGYASEQAALLGVFMHGMAGDRVAEKLGEQGMLPSDLIEELPLAFKELSKKI